MDVIQIRFPTLAVEILNNLDDQSLMKYKESNRDNWKFLGQERFYWIRILKKFNDYFETSRETWRKAISKTSAGIVKKLAIAVFTFFKTESDNFIELHFSLKGDHSPFIPVLIAAYDGDLNFFQQMNEKSSDLKQPPSETKPIQFAAYRGNMAICKLLINECDNNHVYDKSRETTLLYSALGGHLEVYQLFYDSAKVKNPKLEGIGNTPLHFAAAKGHLEVCKFIIGREDNENPANNIGATPLHSAALHGQLEVCHFIFNNLRGKNPASEINPGDNHGDTPLHYATAKGNLDICKFILENITVKNPKNNHGRTPLHMAAMFGHLHVCKLFFDYVDEKNPACDAGITPLHYAAKRGHLDVCKLFMANIKDIHPKNLEDKTPKDLAKERNHVYILLLFQLADI